ncbi:MAG: ComF family protein [Chloroflexi bacterium]|nr:ComF family protein [Chloroflexota bacterium]MCY3939415.1 ComF family protein [Chloroflexota bacterium]
MKVWLRQASGLTLEFLFPPVCPGCGRLGYPICPHCRAEIVPITGSDCRICNRLLDFADICGRCNAARHSLGRVYAAAVYSGPLRDAIIRFKYNNQRFLAETLGDLLARRLREEAVDDFVVTPVPLHRNRQKWRGYNQSALLGKRISEELGLGYEPNGLERLRDTAPQTRQNLKQRLANVRGAFGTGSADLQGKDVLLVDDLSTTGATLEACAKAARKAGASSVRAAVVARG